ncbi:hypothetical protein ACGF0D_43025 [Kitasatospora sp. NPDC048298]|uniref:hypothetical protein n=1 Tax=Kitasatospora sp. NPDC048298 TaxID=3364049 RepID=UPI003718A85E
MDETTQAGQVERTCPGCRRAFTAPSASRRQHCRRSCRQRAYEARQLDAALAQAAADARGRTAPRPTPPPPPAPPAVPEPAAVLVPAGRPLRRQPAVQITFSGVGGVQARATAPNSKKAAQ